MDLVDRLFHRLEEAVAREGSGDGLTVADLYQRLIPYRGVRGDLGILELAPYEDALLRLLAGERGYLRLEDERAREVMARELESPNPILGIYRDFAGLRVGIGTEELPPLASPAPAPSVPLVVREPPPAPALVPPRPRAATPTAPPPPAAAAAGASPVRDRAPAAAPAGCRSCGVTLPPGPDVRFCPLCGADQSMAPCAACGTLLRDEWNFCIRCGQRRER